MRGSAFDGPSEETIGLLGALGETPGESACIAITEQAVGERDNTNNDSLLVDSDASEHYYLDDKISQGLNEYQELQVLRKTPYFAWRRLIL